MTLNLIDSKMVVKNTVTLLPEKSYVFASELCQDLTSLEVEDSGIYGQLDAKSLKVQNNEDFRPLIRGSVKDIDFEKVYFVNKNFDKNSGTSPLEKLNGAKISAEFLSNNSDIDIDNNLMLENIGLTPDYSKNYKFGIEKIKQKYLIEDKNYFKKKSIKNLCRYYKENMKYRSLDPSWGFDNYNCLNFFSIKNSRTAGLTHRNCIVYPNIRQNNINLYNFYGSSNTSTISFYINQNKKNESGYHFNPGCILFVPGIIGLYTVKGLNVDKNGLTDSFRIYASFDDTIDENFLNENIGSSNSAKSGSHFLSSDGVLNYNHWQNVVVFLSYKADLNIVVLEIKIDDETLNTNIVINVGEDYNNNQENSFISIGNNPKNPFSLTTSELFKTLFSVNKTQVGDFLGPYASKHIDFSSNFIEEGVSQISFNLFNSLNETSGDYFTNNHTSLALNAEIHDIRVYNKIIRDSKNIISDNNVTDFGDESLVFCVPVLYYDVDILKKSVVNLYGTSPNSSFSQEISDVDLANLSLSGPVNHIFSNKCLGHEVNVEKFLYEFKNKVSPNIILNNDVSSDQLTYNVLNAIKCSEISVFNKTQELVKKGYAVNDILRAILLDTENSEFLLDYYFINSFEYRNNLILPCDNGLQSQKRYGFVNYYKENEKPKGHFVDNKYFDVSHISLDNFIEDKLILEPTHLKSESGNASLTSFTGDLRSLKKLEDRQDFWVNDTIRFKNNYDIFKNVSLNNFIRTDFSLNDTDTDNFTVKFSEKSGLELVRSYVEIGAQNLFKDLSNPACRKIDDNYHNSIADYLVNIDSKLLDLEGLNIIPYYRTELPIYNITDNKGENFSKSLCFSTQLIGKQLEKDSISIYDSDLAGTFGTLKMTLKDNGRGGLFRSDAKTKIADWNRVGHVLYNEGIINILHPSLENFGELSYKIDYTGNTNLNVLELNLPAYAGRTNKTYNNSAVDNLRLNESAFNSDEDFVYITDINLHDENLNVVAKAKIVKPYAKKDSDGVLFRLKMDY